MSLNSPLSVGRVRGTIVAPLTNIDFCTSRSILERDCLVTTLVTMVTMVTMVTALVTKIHIGETVCCFKIISLE